MAGEWLTATANTNMFTYEIAPVFILMENVVMTHMREIIGKNWRKGDSILAPGIAQIIVNNSLNLAFIIYIIYLKIFRKKLFFWLTLYIGVKTFINSECKEFLAQSQ